MSHAGSTLFASGPSSTQSLVVLHRNSHKVQTCLESAARSHERARTAVDSEQREFFLKMERTWMRLAASIAHSERVDLFLLNNSHFRPADRCVRCEARMRLKLVDVTRESERHTFECLQCGFEQVASTVH